MRKEVDYIAEHESYMRILNTEPKEPVSEREMNWLHLTMARVAAETSQYVKERDNGLWNRVEEEFYPLLCQLAEVCGGRVELELDENTLIGTLVYVGKYLLLSNIYQRDTEQLAHILAAADAFSIATEGEYFRLQFSFALYRKVFVEDHSAQIQSIQAQIDANRGKGPSPLPESP